jgi:hypothetical protein
MSGSLNIASATRMMFGKSQHRLVAVLGAFLDDSGTHRGAPVIVMGGLLGTEAQWDMFAAAWTRLLAEPLPGKPPLREFHLTECRAREGEFATYNEAERNRITYLFRRIIIDNGFITIAATIDKRAWEELVVDDIREALGGPLPMCFVKCADSIVDIMRQRLHRDERVAIFVDQGVETDLGEWLRLYRLQMEKYPEIVSAGFAPVGDVIALQGADMIATETYQFSRAWLEDRINPRINPHFREFVSRNLSAGIIFDRDAIAEVVTRFRASGVP